jgi:hypothetical protein
LLIDEYESIPMTPTQARVKLIDLLTEVGDLAVALRALDLWDAVMQVVPRATAVATIDTDSLLNDGWWVGDRVRYLRHEAREVERARVLEMFQAAAIAYGDANHTDIEVRNTREKVAGDIGKEIWDWARDNAPYDEITHYQPRTENLEPEEHK